MALTICDTLEIQQILYYALMDYAEIVRLSGIEYKLRLTSWRLRQATYLKDFSKERLDYFVDILYQEDREAFSLLYPIVLAIREQENGEVNEQYTTKNSADSSQMITLLPLPNFLRRDGGGFGSLFS